MKDTWLIYPMFAMVLLTFSTLVRLFRARVSLVKEGQIEVSYYRLYQGAAEPERSAKLSRHFINQFESPLLFYAACLAAIAVHATSMTLLCWHGSTSLRGPCMPTFTPAATACASESAPIWRAGQCCFYCGRRS